MTEKDDAQEALRLARPLLGVYQHYKGPLYTLFCVSLDERTLEILVHYYSHEKRTRWTRTLQNFLEDTQRPMELASVPRFVRVRDASYLELTIAVGFNALAEELAEELAEKG